MDLGNSFLHFLGQVGCEFLSLKLRWHRPLLLRRSRYPLLWLLMHHILLWDLCHRSLSLLSDIVPEVIGVDLLPRAHLMDLVISSCLLLTTLIFNLFILCEALLLSKLLRSLTLVNFHLLLRDVCLLARFNHIFKVTVLCYF